MKNEILDINKRFLQVMKENNYSGYKFAKEFKEVSESKLTHIRSGRNQPSTDLIGALLKKFPQIDCNWLLTGEGETPEKEKLYNIDTNNLPVHEPQKKQPNPHKNESLQYQLDMVYKKLQDLECMMEAFKLKAELKDELKKLNASSLEKKED